MPGEVIRGGISEEGRGSGRSPEVFKVLSSVSVAGRPGRCRPEVASRPGPGRRGPLAGRLDAVPARYRAAIWLGAGQGCRLGEALGVEVGARCIDQERGGLHIVQQLRYAPQEHGGFYLSEPKAGSSGTVHALRHFFATTLITNHAEPQEVQRMLRHKTLRITLETYVHWWPKRDRPRGIVGNVLRSALTGLDQA
ncbi:tyrosine-type recombinase/integrase [Micromonospora sp. A200]|uniref:tyrosine-type recombinase/integrase n=1 Tax=Micromonospora sp. A200 TaxID=2940568 RepID=UPI002473693B|nr:tyrosine-type recombinase/integrase [Micromonospora sp. A200]